MRAERSADGRKRLACCVQRSIAVGGKRVDRSHSYFPLLTIRVNGVINDHVVGSEAVMGGRVRATGCRKHSNHVAPDRVPISSRDSEDDVTYGKLRDTNNASCPLFDFHVTRNTVAELTLYRIHQSKVTDSKQQ